jgi:hypothetical protein
MLIAIIGGIHFGKNPINGGSPPNDSRDENIMILTDALLLTVIV